MANTESPFRYFSADAVRIWLNYQLDKRNSISFSPFAYFSVRPTINHIEDVDKPAVSEYRLWVLHEHHIPISKNMKVRLRNGAEWRMYDSNTPLLRMRNRGFLDYSFNHRNMLYISDELFLNTIHVTEANIFDQNRCTMGYQYQISKSIAVDFGVFWDVQRRRNTLFETYHYIFFMNTTWRI
jgi:hypothetical protein